MRHQRASKHSHADVRGRRPRAKANPDYSTESSNISDTDYRTEASSHESSKTSDPDFADDDIDHQHGRFGGEPADEDSHSCSSLDSNASGPAPYRLPVQAPPLKQDTPPGLCPDCQQLYRDAIKRRTAQPPTVTDDGEHEFASKPSDPTSLASIQWVLKKEWKPKRPSNNNGRLGDHLRRIKRRRQSDRDEGDEERQACWRPHAFLPRNLRQCAGTAVDRRRARVRGRKRSRTSGQGPLVAKRLRLQVDPVPRDDSRQADPGCEDYDNDVSDSNDNDGNDSNDIVALGPKQEALKRSCEFRDLLAQIRGNSNSIIVREKRT